MRMRRITVEVRVCNLLSIVAGVVLALTGTLEPGAWAQQEAGTSSLAAGGSKQGWQLHPSLSVGEHFSDNIFLAARGLEQSEWTTRINPAIRISGNSARLRLNANYAPELIHRTNLNTTEVFQFFDATGYGELVSRTLFVDARAAVSQQNVSLLAPQADSNINANSNRTTVRRYSVSPYLHHEFGPNAVGELRLTNDAVRAGANRGGVVSSTSNKIDASISSGPAYKLLTWNFTLTKARINYDVSAQRIDQQRMSAMVGSLLTPEVRLVGNVGYENSGYPSATGQELKGAFWEVGPEWTPSQRTRLSATYGRRYFGASRALHFEHRARRAVWGFDYSEGATTVRSNILLQAPSVLAVLVDTQLRNDPQFQDPIVRQTEVQRIVAATPTANVAEPVNFLTDALFLDKRLQGTVGIEGLKNRLITSVFTSNRSPLSSGTGAGADFAAAQTVRQTGASMSWTLRTTPTLTSNLNIAASRNSFSALNRTDRVLTVRWSLTKQFDPRVTGSFNLGRQQIDYNPSASNYRETSSSVTLAVRY